MINENSTIISYSDDRDHSPRRNYYYFFSDQDVLFSSSVFCVRFRVQVLKYLKCPLAVLCKYIKIHIVIEKQQYGMKTLESDDDQRWGGNGAHENSIVTQ